MDIVQAVSDTLMYFGLWRGLLAVLTLGLAYIMAWTWMTWWKAFISERYKRKLAEF